MSNKNEKEILLGGCHTASIDLSIDFNCCSSCHEDAELGYEELASIETDKGYYLVCCSCSNTYKAGN